MEQSDVKKSQALLKAVYDDGFAEINGRKYVFNKTTHKKRLKVFAFFTSIQHLMSTGNFSFMDGAEFDGVVDVIEGIVSIDDELLIKKKLHWEEFPEDYLKFITTAMGVISYPFLGVSGTN